jgi:hypothetical protein
MIYMPGETTHIIEAEPKTGYFLPEGFCPARFGEYYDGDSAGDSTSIDEESKLEEWPTADQVARIESGQTSLRISSYGLATYRAFQEEQGIEIVLLDPRVYYAETDLADAMQEAARIAMDEGASENVAPFLRGIIGASTVGNRPGDFLAKYMDVFIESHNPDEIREYVERICEYTVKGTDRSKQTLKTLAHKIKDLRNCEDSAGSRTEIILEGEIVHWLQTLGYAWIRRSMPVAEIDWLP